MSRAQGKQAERAGHYFKRSRAAETSNSRLRKTKANLEEKTKAACRTQDETQTMLSEAVAAVQQVRKVCESQIEELEDDLAVVRKELESIRL